MKVQKDKVGQGKSAAQKNSTVLNDQKDFFAFKTKKKLPDKLQKLLPFKRNSLIV